jgi:hypothetical protein
MVSGALSPVRKGYPYAVTRGGLTYVFETAEEQAVFLEGNEREQRRERGLKALERVRRVHESILERTGGVGISEEDVDQALREVRER